MAQETFNLKDVDIVLIHLKDTATPEQLRLMTLIRDQYQSDEEIESLTSIDNKKILPRLFPKDFRSLPEKVWALESLREELDQLLVSLAEQNNNPKGIRVSDQNILFSDPAIQTTTERRAFKPSELSFKLPDTLHQEFKSQLNIAQQQSETSNTKLNELIELEEKLTQTRLELEQEKADFRSDLQGQVEQLEATLENERKVYQEEINALRKKLDQLQGERSSFQQEAQSDTETEIQKTLEQNQETLDETSSIKQELESLKNMVENLTLEDKKRLEQNTKAIKGLQKRAQDLKKYATVHFKKQKEYQTRVVQMDKSNKAYRNKLKKSYQEKVKELQRDFKKQSGYFERIKDVEGEERRRVEAERNELIQKRQNLLQEIRTLTDEQFKQRETELSNKEKDLEKRQKQIILAEKKFAASKEGFLKQIKGERDTRYSREELNAVLKEQNEILDEMKTLRDELDDQKKQSEKLVEHRLDTFEKEQDKLIQFIKSQQDKLLEEIKRLKDRQSQQIIRETEEIMRLHDEYEGLKTSLEVEQIEKDEEIESKLEEVRRQEEEVLNQLKENNEVFDDTQQFLENQQDDVLQQLEEVHEIKEDILGYQMDAQRFLEKFQSEFQSRMDTQRESFESFQQRMKELEEESARIQEDMKTRQSSSNEERQALEQSIQERATHHETLMKELEKELRAKVSQYQEHVAELNDSRKKISEQDREQMEQLLSGLSDYEEKLHEIGQAFEQLSEVFHEERKRGGIQIVEDDPPPASEMPETQVVFREELARREWILALYQLQEKHQLSEDPKFLRQWNEHWDQWVTLPAGKFQMGRPNSRDSAPYQEVSISKPLNVMKYPVTNLEFFMFVYETGYVTEAEHAGNAIVYFNGSTALAGEQQSVWSNPTLEPVENAAWHCPNGQPASLNEKHHHPVTQITWNDAHAYCEWKSEVLGKTVRLPKESEWEYIASGLGQHVKNDLPWNRDDSFQFLNVEESGVGDTLPVDFLPETDVWGGAQGMLGNVYEWVQDAPGPSLQNSTLDYKVVRGGSFLTLIDQVTHWRRLMFVADYRTSFLGFRVVSEE